MANAGALGAHFCGPADGGRVVYPGCCVLVPEVGDEVLEHQCLEEYAGHFEIVDGDCSILVFAGHETGLDVLGPFDAPDRWWEVVLA